MTTKRLFGYLLVAIAIPYLTSCTDDNKVTEKTEISTGMYILNEGKMSNNNATMTYYDFDHGYAVTDIFAQKNERGLGDTGQDIIQYGSKIYVAVSGSSTMEVINTENCVSIKSISLLDANGKSSSPRSLTCANGKVYVVLFSGYVAQIDTTTYITEKTVKVGISPNESVIANNKLYVANTGSYTTGYDNTISVINLQSFAEEKKITVNTNPYGNIGADSQGNVYIQSSGNYGNIPGKFQRIEAGTDKVTDIDLSMKGFKVYNDKAYIYDYTNNANWQAATGTVKIAVYDLKNQKLISSNIINSSDIDKTPYGIGVNPVTNDIYVGVTDYTNLGKVYCFSANGVKKNTFNVGVNPRKFLFVTKKQ